MWITCGHFQLIQNDHYLKRTFQNGLRTTTRTRRRLRRAAALFETKWRIRFGIRAIRSLFILWLKIYHSYFVDNQQFENVIRSIIGVFVVELSQWKLTLSTGIYRNIQFMDVCRVTIRKHNMSFFFSCLSSQIVINFYLNLFIFRFECVNTNFVHRVMLSNLDKMYYFLFACLL